MDGDGVGRLGKQVLKMGDKDEDTSPGASLEKEKKKLTKSHRSVLNCLSSSLFTTLQTKPGVVTSLTLIVKSKLISSLGSQSSQTMPHPKFHSCLSRSCLGKSEKVV